MSKHLSDLRERDEVLTNLAIGHKQGAFIGERIAPVVYVEKEGIKVPKYGKGAFVEYDTERAVGADSNVITLDRGGYMPVVLEEHDLAAGVDYREQHESRFDEQAKAARRVTAGVQLKQEIEIAKLIQTRDSYASGHHKDLASATQWSTGTSDPQEDIANAKETVRAACGVKPNVLVVGASVLHQLSLHDGLRGLLASGERKAILGIDILKSLLDVDDIIVGEAVASADGKKPTQDVWGKFAALIVRPTIATDGNDENVPAFAYTFRRRGMPVVDRYDGVGGKVEFVRYTDIRKAAVIGGACGFLFENAIA
ncbi:hypothetical protein [Neisseria shayeganii]|uniref:Phage associated protein n=1 Tax=Neisseria shayeganii 871 TaxID=1032488 RepID=G4CJG4_9NEIS|nr:hypothetical protein [Neisseria shayeganii]EGY52015.1 hypothetical protein HMPREF9371_1754 [Neisseria shayeganii 871]